MFCVGITFFLRQHQTDKHVPGHGRRTFSHFLRDSSSPLCLWSLCAAVGKHYSISRWSWWEYRWDWSPSPGWARQSASGAPVVDLAATTPTMMSHSAWLDSGVGGGGMGGQVSIISTPYVFLSLWCCCLAAVRVPLVTTWSPMRMWSITDPLPIRLLSIRRGPQRPCVDMAPRQHFQGVLQGFIL